MAMCLEKGKLAELTESLPSRIEDALEQPPLCMVLKQVNKRNIEAFLAIELTKLKSRVNIDDRLNLQASQMPFVCAQLIDLFPNESLADFKICFERGAMGRYSNGKLLRLDGATLADWMRAYLDEKYSVVEDRLMREKDKSVYEPSKETADVDKWLAKWKESIGFKPSEKTPQREVSDYEKAKMKYQPPSPNELKKKYYHAEWIKENFDAISGKPKLNAISENEWLLNKGFILEDGNLKEI